MPENHLHIISFNIPYPPNYGGIIDVYYKIKALHSAGIKIHLHCFEYGREIPEALNKLCAEIYYYNRKTGLLSALSLTPYIVKSRNSEALITNLTKDKHPILFEGLHSCYYLNDKRLTDRLKIYRESNIEHHYYYHLFRSEKNLFKRIYFLIASLKLRIFQSILKHASLMLVVSKTDAEYLKQKFPKNKIVYLPSFHSNKEITLIKGKGDYVLYHGNLSVPENEQAAIYLTENIFNDIEIPFIIAGLNPTEKLTKLISNHQHITLVANPDDTAMNTLISEAQINILLTFQATGLKLKLLNTLYRGRYCLVNSKMLAGTNLESLCRIADIDDQLKIAVKELFNTEFNNAEVQKRKEILSENYSNHSNLQKLINLIYTDK